MAIHRILENTSILVLYFFYGKQATSYDSVTRELLATEVNHVGVVTAVRKEGDQK